MRNDFTYKNITCFVMINLTPRLVRSRSSYLSFLNSPHAMRSYIISWKLPVSLSTIKRFTVSKIEMESEKREIVWKVLQEYNIFRIGNDIMNKILYDRFNRFQSTNHWICIRLDPIASDILYRSNLDFFFPFFLMEILIPFGWAERKTRSREWK